MALKDILVHVDDARGHESRLALAAELAGRHEAHLTGLFVIEPISFAGLASSAGTGFAAAEAFQAIQETHRAARGGAGARLEKLFRTAADRPGIGAEWCVVEADAAAAVTLHARYADLAVLGQSDPDHQRFGAAVPEAVLLGSGRPVLVVPYIGAKPPLGRRVLAMWNASREAARAVNDALPLIAAAESVTVLSINPARGTAGEGDLPAAVIAHHLARHGVKAESAYTAADGLGADLIVMGGYGHSRTRELVLGGATRTLLRHMTVPVLLSH